MPLCASVLVNFVPNYNLQAMNTNMTPADGSASLYEFISCLGERNSEVGAKLAFFILLALRVIETIGEHSNGL
jgi:hypothetical protein